MAPPPTATLEPTAYVVPSAGLAIWQVLLRYNGENEFGTFEATICNLDGVPAENFSVRISANDIEIGGRFNGSLAGRTCTGVYDDFFDFTFFGIKEPQMATVTVRLTRADGHEAVRIEEMEVRRLRPSNPERQAAFEDCAGADEGSQESCLPNVRTDALAAPHEIKKQSGKYAAIVLARFENLANWWLADLQACDQAISEYLGVEQPFNPLVGRVTASEQASQHPEGYYVNPGVGIVLWTDTANLRGILAGVDAFWNWENMLAGKCSQADRVTQAFMVDTPIHQRLIEGLGVFMTHPQRANWYAQVPAIRCEENGYTEYPGQAEETLWPYEDLTSQKTIAARRYSNTAACFWEYIEKEYGVDGLRQIVQGIAAERDAGSNRYCDRGFRPRSPFLERFVEPVLGLDISAVTEELFGFGEDWSPCDVDE